MDTRLFELTYGRKVRLLQLALLATLVFLLEYVTRTGMVSYITLTSPTAMVSTLVELVRSGAIVDDFIQSATAVFVAFGASVATGIPVGWLLWRRQLLHQILDPYLVAWYALPIFAFYPMLIAIFGLNRTPIILISYAISVIVVVVNTANGFNKVKDVYAKVGRSLKLSRSQAFRHVYFPAAAPYIFTGLKLGFVYAIVGVLASEFILADAGLGYQVSFSYRNFETNDMYAVMLLIVAIAVTVNLLLLRIEDRLYRRSVTY